jgi:D-arabinose 1-dehydrogenase-like Zn-dependent alcohol dehydrogenase
MRSECRTNRGFVPQFKALTPPFVCWSAVFCRVFRDPLTRVLGQLSPNPSKSDASLTINGTLVLLGYVGDLESMLSTVPLVMGRRSVAGSVIGGIAETQEMLDFCGKHGITSDIEVIKIQDINTAYDRMLKSDVKYRFVIDMASLKD